MYMYVYIYIYIFILYYVTTFCKSKQVQYTDHFIKKCGQIFSLPQSVYKSETGRAKKSNKLQLKQTNQTRTNTNQDQIRTSWIAIIFEKLSYNYL